MVPVICYALKTNSSGREWNARNSVMIGTNLRRVVEELDDAPGALAVVLE